MDPHRRNLVVAIGGLLVVIVLLGVVTLSGQPVPTATPPASSLPPVEASPSPVSVSPSASPSASAVATFPPATPPPGVGGTPVPCGSYDPTCSQMPVDGAGAAITPPVPCGTLGTCTLFVNILRPRTGGPWPVVVMVPGGPQAPGNLGTLGDFARLVASQGAVVFVADYREGPEWGGGSPTTYQDIACAIRFARANAAQYGGDGARLILAAHSLGPFFASVVALSADPFTPDPGACLTTTGSTKPDGFVGISGDYSPDSITPSFLDSFFGGSRDERASAWTAGDPYEVAAAKARLMPIRLVHGTQDRNVPIDSSKRFLAALQAAGFDATLTPVDADHQSILQNSATIRVILETANALP